VRDDDLGFINPLAPLNAPGKQIVLPNRQTDMTMPNNQKLNNQVVGNVGLYYVCYRLSLDGWNVMPTARNARGVDMLIYSQDAVRTATIQIKTFVPGSTRLRIGTFHWRLGDHLPERPGPRTGVLCTDAGRSARASPSSRKGWSRELLARAAGLRA
jgi:hypothetical protein